MQQLALKTPVNDGSYYFLQENLNFSGQTLTLKTDTPADIINSILPFVFIIAGLILFVMLIIGGFTIFTSTGNPEKIKKGQGIITNALIGFLIIFATYWIIQLLEATLGIQVL